MKKENKLEDDKISIDSWTVNTDCCCLLNIHKITIQRDVFHNVFHNKNKKHVINGENENENFQFD